MCTLIALHRCYPDASLVVAANRDEYLDRPAEGPALRALGDERATAQRLDTLLWNRGQAPSIKARPRHRARSVFY